MEEGVIIGDDRNMVIIFEGMIVVVFSWVIIER